MRLLTPLHHCLWSFLLLSTGYGLALFVIDFQTVAAPETVRITHEDIHRRMPHAEITEINRGSIIGSVGSDVRLTIAGKPIIPDSDGSFRIAAAPFLVNVVDIAVPSEARFVASSQGTTYYDVTSRAWLNWKSEPIFFRSEREAIAAGYKPSASLVKK